MPGDTSRSEEEAPAQLELFHCEEQRKPKKYGIFLESGKLGVTVGGKASPDTNDVSSNNVPLPDLVADYPFGPILRNTE